MGTMQHAIEVKAPVHMVYDCLTHFEEYPRFMEDVEAVRRLDDTHLQWVTRMDNRPVEWEAEITEQQADRCIAWHNLSGPENSGRLELQALDDAHSRVIYTWHLEPQQVPGPKAGDPDELMSQRLKADLERMKDFIESTSDSKQGAMNQGKSVSTSAPPHAGTAAVVGALGGTDAAAGAKLSGSKGGPGGASLRELVDNSGTADISDGTAAGNDVSPGAGANAAGGTGLGSTATADDTRTGTGSSSGSGTALTGGGMSGARGPGVTGNSGGRPS